MVMEELERPAAFPPPHPREVERIETHASWVFLGDRDVFKVKKPVRFPFLDFSTLEKRKRACEAEVTLNSRPAARPPGAVGAGGKPFGQEGEVVDWAVHMVRLP